MRGGDSSLHCATRCAAGEATTGIHRLVMSTRAPTWPLRIIRQLFFSCSFLILLLRPSLLPTHAHDTRHRQTLAFGLRPGVNLPTYYFLDFFIMSYGVGAYGFGDRLAFHFSCVLFLLSRFKTVGSILFSRSLVLWESSDVIS